MFKAPSSCCRGTDQINFTLNFSKGASQIVAQYYQFLRLGRSGYTKIMQNCHAVAMYLQKAIEDTGYFIIISARDPVPMLPLATFSLKSEYRLNGCAASSPKNLVGSFGGPGSFLCPVKMNT